MSLLGTAQADFPLIKGAFQELWAGLWFFERPSAGYKYPLSSLQYASLTTENAHQIALA